MSSDSKPGMVARLGRVIYWACSGVAILIVIGGAGGTVYIEREALLGVTRGQHYRIVAVDEPVDDRSDSHTDAGVVMAATLVVAGGFWLFGRAARYVLAGK